jgi:hypothetical protein
LASDDGYRGGGGDITGDGDNISVEGGDDDVMEGPDPVHLVDGTAVHQWDKAAVLTWLARVGLPKPALSAFDTWDVDGSMLLELEEVLD